MPVLSAYKFKTDTPKKAKYIFQIGVPLTHLMQNLRCPKEVSFASANR